ncbi:MAG: tetratricopeptide repeat protein [Pirellulaceae bacterium]
MFQRFAWMVPLALVAALAGANAARAQSLDQVQVVKGPPSRGTVSKITKDAVTLDMSGIGRPFPVNEITRVLFEGEPSELAAARMHVLQKNYGAALQELRKLDGQNGFKPFVAADIAYYKATCLAQQAMTEGGDKPAALKTLLDWVKSNADSFHFYEAAETLGDLAAASGDYAKAVTYYTGLSGAPWGDYQMRGNIAVGRALIAQKQYSEALQKFESVIAADLSTTEATTQKQLATVGKAVCLAETDKVDVALALLNDLIAKNDPADGALFARAYNALGNCYLKMDRPKDALQAYLHTDILFYAETEAHAEALYRLSKLWNDVNKADRAVAARNTLRERYAGSVWASLE